MRGALLLIATLLAGCSAPFQGAGSEALHEPAGACAQLLVNVSSQWFVMNATPPLGIQVTLRNCGSVPLERGEDPRCGPGPSLRLSHEGEEYALPVGEENRTPVSTSIYGAMHGPCGILDHARDLAPGESATENATWNGTVEDVACPVTGASGSECAPSPRAAAAGYWQIEARLEASDGPTRYQWTATRTVQALAPEGISHCVHGCPPLQYITSSPVDLSKVAAVSKARTADSPPPANASRCDCGFMVFEPANPYHCDPAHPACPLPPTPPLDVYAPFDGTVVAIRDPAKDHVGYVVIASEFDPSFSFWIVGTQAVEGLHEGENVSSGQHVANGEQALGFEDNRTGDPQGGTIVPPMAEFLSTQVKAYFAQHGLPAENLTYPGGGPDVPSPLLCDPTTGNVGPLSEDEWIRLPPAG